MINWEANKPVTTDSKHCGIIYNGLMWDHDCGRQEKFLCKIGATACGPKGKLVIWQNMFL